MTAVIKTIDEWSDTAYLVLIGGRCPVCFVTGPHKHRIDPLTGEFDVDAERVTV